MSQLNNIEHPADTSSGTHNTEPRKRKLNSPKPIDLGEPLLQLSIDPTSSTSRLASSEVGFDPANYTK
ncbi:hypothetical protein BCV72DRAFT_337144 [Rhizopus microsporus var. microsporus]|uniref:Uncharacterized protein n=1 Tax=Rhizopus microsporus var. microsporus TaxID=86635 RepID=A0A1X0QXW5_RHIZD|nr:hypothetical protein BCV72DRAFT_337144 [Rhizopus microsporus var. microsporus]